VASTGLLNLASLTLSCSKVEYARIVDRSQAKSKANLLEYHSQTRGDVMIANYILPPSLKIE
jgi:hypothetical protein